MSKTSPTDHPTATALTQSARHVGSATLVSRLLGFVRDVLLARYFGTGVATEAFVVAFRIPNLFRELVAEGAASAAFVPTLSAAHARDSSVEWRHLVSVLATTLAILLGVAIALAILAAPWLVRVLAPGFAHDGPQWELTVILTRLLLPYLWMMGMVAVTTSALHVLRQFRMPAWNPVLMNIAIIVACVVWVPRRLPDEGMIAVGVSILVAGLLQMAANHIVLWRLQVRVTPQLDWRLPALAHIARLMGPRIFGAAVYQLGVLLDTIMASLAWIVGQGGVAALYFASRLIQFPLGLAGVSMATVSLPTLAQQAAQRDKPAFRSTLLVGMRSITFIMLPAGVGLFLVADPLVRMLFQRGAFDVLSSHMTSWALQWSAVGLWAFAITKLLVNAHYALHDTRAPVRWAGIGLGCNLILNLLLMYPMGVGGLALGTSLAACIECVGLWRSIERRVGRLDRAVWRRSCSRLGLATLGMGCWTAGGLQLLGSTWIGLCAVMIVSVLIYGGIARWLNADELHWILRRRVSGNA